MKWNSVIKLIFLFSLVCVAKSDSPEELEKVPEKPKYVIPVPVGPFNFLETFDVLDLIGKEWIQSLAKKDDVDDLIAKYDGKWAIEPSIDSVLEGDMGLVLKSKAKHHAISSKIMKPFHFSNKKPLIIQYEVKFQNPLECGGAYVKLLAQNADFKLESFHDKTPFSIMFGPDKCGTENKYHFIIRYKNPVTGTFEEKHAKKSELVDAFFTDGKTHLFTLIVRPDNTFQMLIDTTEVNAGSLLTDLSPPIVPPKEIVDPNDKKPETWDDREKIEDPDAVKPEDWDEEEPKQIADASAQMPEGWLEDESDTIPDESSVKPDDWDEDTDGEWEPAKIENPKCKDAPGCGPWTQPMINNPKYKGKWRAPLIENTNYQGQWEPRKIENPEYFEETDPFSKLTSFDGIGFELWSMTDKIYFDNILITDDEAVANKFALDSWAIKKDLESINSRSSDSVVDALVNATNDKPWLWAVYLLVVLVPIVLIFVFCCGKSSPEVKTNTKKTDEPTKDDDNVQTEANAASSNEKADEEEDADEEEEVEEAEPENKQSKSDLEDEDQQPEEQVQEEAAPVQKTATKRKPRKD